MSKTVFISAAALLCATSNADWYTDEGAFLTAIAPAHYLEDFDEFQYGVHLNGTQTNWSAPGSNGFGWDAFASLGLWSIDGALSTSMLEDPLVITFTGAPVTAFGGIFYATDNPGFIVPGTDVRLILSNGASQTFTSSGTEFLGWAGESALTSVELSVAPMSGTFITADHVYTGTMVPEPAGFAAGGLGLAWCLVRSRKKT